MVQKQQAGFSTKTDNEDFRVLRNSNFWKYLPRKIRQDISLMLGEDREE